MEAFLHNPETWVAAAFLLFVLLVGKKIATFIAGGLDQRAVKIRAELDEARRLRNEAEDLLMDYQRRQREALQQADDIVGHAKTEAERLKREQMVALDQSLQRREKLALEKIAQAERQALADVKAHAVDLAVKAAQELLRDSLDMRQAARLADAAIAEVGKRLN